LQPLRRRAAVDLFGARAGPEARTPARFRTVPGTRFMCLGERPMLQVNRHDLYYRLIDVGFICQLCLVMAVAYKGYTGVSATGGLLYYPFAVIMPIGFLLPPVLVFQRWMRDDFSEMLWQRAAGTVLKAVVVLPIPVMFVTAVGIGARVSLGLDAASDYTAKRTMGLPTALEGQLMGHIMSMTALWLIASLLFTFAFQWHRWRAGR
jgi:hypothetical protein